MLKHIASRPLFAFDLLFVVSVALAIFINHNITLVVTLLSCTSLVYLALSGKLKMPSMPLLGVAGVFLCYLVTVQILTVVHTGLPPDVSPKERYFFPDQLHLLGVVIVLTGMLRIANFMDLFAAIRLALPATLVLIFMVLSYLMFMSTTDSCRITGFTFMPFTPALFFSSLTLLSFAGWSRLARAERMVRYALISLSIVVVAAYTQSRGISIALALCLTAMTLFTLVRHRDKAVPNPFLILVSIFAGFLLCGVIEGATGCPAVTRTTDTLETMGIVVQDGISKTAALATSETAAPAGSETVQPGTNEAARPFSGEVAPPELMPLPVVAPTVGNIFERLRFWKLGWDRFRASPWFGHGVFYEQVLLFEEYGHTHVHDQYLSWLLWGGIPMLCLGFVFLFAAVFFVMRSSKFDALTIILATSAIMAISLVTDSFFRFDVYVFMHILLGMIGVGLSGQLMNAAVMLDHDER